MGMMTHIQLALVVMLPCVHVTQGFWCETLSLASSLAGCTPAEANQVDICGVINILSNILGCGDPVTPTVTPTNAPASPVDNQQQAFTAAQKQEILDNHNTHRAGEGSSDMIKMTWNTDLESFSQQLANQCLFAHSSNAARTNVFGFSFIGENIYVNTGSFQSGGVGDNWFSEKQYYNYDFGTCQFGQQCGHYTQMAWANSRELGCAVKWCSSIPNWNNRAAYLVYCHYGPGGNIIGQKPFTKGTSCSACPSGATCDNGLCVL